ncbi:MAG TPA: ATP-binding protein [Chloroflexota bacterium]|jgi:signal transduction histidine kinase
MLEDSAAGARRRRWWAGLGAKLFLAFGAVVLVGVSTLWVGVSLTAPGLFEQHMQGMMGGGLGSMMGGTSGAMDASLTAAFREAMGQALVLATLAAVLAAVVASLFVTGRILRPLRRLASASRRLADGHYAERVPTGGNDELGDLAMTFNDMAATLEATERRRRELVGDIAHELRTPIATLEGYLEGLLDGVVKPQPTTWARLHDETSRLRRLVDDLQELSRAEARQIPLALQSLDAADIVRAAVDRLAPSFADKGLGLHCDVADGMPHVQGDPNRAIQVLSNLLTNALRYTPVPGAVHVDVRPVNGAVQFSVRDTGMGIAPEDLPRVFERFYRVDKSRSRALGGSGIGLTIARALVEAMGGVIWAESPGPGHGATFTFTLPRD